MSQQTKLQVTARVSKTEILPSSELRDLKKYVKSFLYVKDAADKIGIDRQTLDRVLLLGKASPANISIIREKLKQEA